MNRKVYFILFAILIGYPSFSNDDIVKPFDIKKEIVGLYEIQSFNSSYSLVLQKNGRFKHEIWGSSCFGLGESQVIRGKYEINGNNLKLIPETLINKEFYSDSVTKLDSTTYYSSETTYLKKEYQIFLWDHFIFLMSDEYYLAFSHKSEDNDYIRFAQYYNWGYSPYLTNGHYFVKKNKKKLASGEFDYSKIPEPYRKLFLKKSIEATIAEIKEITTEKNGILKITKQFKLNKGTKDSIYVGLNFSSLKQYEIQFGSVYGSLKVISVEESFSYAIFPEYGTALGYEIGDAFSTITHENRDD